MPAIVSLRFLINYFADKQFCQKTRTFRIFCIYSDKSLSCKFSRQKCNFCKQVLHFCKPAPEFPKTRTIIFKRKARRGKSQETTRQKLRNDAAKAAPFLSLSINILHTISSSSTQGELEGAKPASNQIKCRAKPCLARRAWSEATIFVPQGGTKITTLFQAAEKAGGFFGSLRNSAAKAAPFLGFPRYLLLRSTSHSVSYTRAVDATSSRSRTE